MRNERFRPKKLYNEIRSKYRILSNGTEYSMEQLTRVGFLWWKKFKWKPVLTGDYLCGHGRRTWSDLKSTKKSMNNYILQDMADEVGWLLLSESEAGE